MLYRLSKGTTAVVGRASDTWPVLFGSGAGDRVWEIPEQPASYFLMVPPARSLLNAFMNLELFLLLTLGEGTKAEVFPERCHAGIPVQVSDEGLLGKRIR